jgi:hypothetical protein
MKLHSEKYTKHTEVVRQRIASNSLQLEDLKRLYYQELNIVDDSSRHRHLVEPRMAFSAAFRHYFTKTDLGRVFGKTHATVIHYIKTHEILISDVRYAQYYKAACFIRGMYLNNETPNQLEQQVKFLEIENANLKNELHLLRNKLEECILISQSTHLLDSSLA